ncbi:hypothetical protein KIN20_015670 [Parelaphostrongylus tenuis]|uniref:Uncharacterized protein n=1 Tax=Parelaphostrongylus tenuis TaxID=148309 RepID=A0AAD5QQ57_PARTN|nr:hypothetical protein KIN20_015670 [Parelaphostrongylus tenuis]
MMSDMSPPVEDAPLDLLEKRQQVRRESDEALHAQQRSEDVGLDGKRHRSESIEEGR